MSVIVRLVRSSAMPKVELLLIEDISQITD